MERINARYLDELPEAIDLAVIDASFISLALILPAVREWFEGDSGRIIALIKPQFEAGRKAAAVHAGVIKDKAIHEKVLKETLMNAQALGFYPMGLIASPIRGPKGNVEFLVDLSLQSLEGSPNVDWMIQNTIRGMPE
jgi:23S rRNA (cytidine1920-2'-O)/16S rRNA (cytidine1409-2'-O)-methyltransferase